VAITLPYDFDTNPLLKLVLHAVIGLLAVVVIPGILYSVFYSHDWVVVVELALIAAIVGYFSITFGRHLASTSGTITKEFVVIWPVTFYGLRVSGADRRYSIAQFSAVRVESISTAANVRRGQHERVSLVGRDGAPNILVARTENFAGKALGQQLAAALNLDFREQSAPY
jgi:hypothetical protein